MNVLHVIDKLNVGGAEKVLLMLTGLLAKEGIDTGVLIYNEGGVLESSLHRSVKVHQLNRKNKYNIATLYKANKICCEYDIVHTHLRHVYAYIKLSKHLFGGRFKLLLHDHSAPTNRAPARLSGMFKPEWYIGVNKELQQWAKTVLHVDSERTFLLENTVLAAETAYTSKGNGKLLMVANIRREKNIAFAIELSMLLNRPLDVYGEVKDEEYYNQLKVSGAENVKFIHGVTDFRNGYNNYELAIHTSTSETGPLVLLEYLSAGMPFLASKVGGVADAIAEYLPQLFMEHWEPKMWEKRIQMLTTDKELPQQMRNVFQQHFSPEEYLNKCLQIYSVVHSS